MSSSLLFPTRMSWPALTSLHHWQGCSLYEPQLVEELSSDSHIEVPGLAFLQEAPPKYETRTVTQD